MVREFQGAPRGGAENPDTGCMSARPDPELLDEAGCDGVLGPWKLINVPAVSANGGRELKKNVAILIIEGHCKSRCLHLGRERSGTMQSGRGREEAVAAEGAEGEGVPSFPRNCGFRELQDADRRVLSAMCSLGGDGKRPRRGGGIDHCSGPGLLRAGGERILAHPPGLAFNMPRRPSLRDGVESQSPSCRSAARSALGSSVDCSSTRVPSGCSADTRKDCGGTRPAKHEPFRQSGRPRQAQQGRSRGHRREQSLSSSLWFLPQVFPSGLDDSLSASSLCSILQRFC